MDRDYRYRVIAGILLFVLALIVMISLISYRIDDYNLLALNKPVNNILGPFGSVISSFLRTAFGFSAYIICIIITVIGWRLLKRGALSYMIERVFSLSFVLISLTGLLSLLFSENVPQFSGGYIGLYLSGMLEKFSGRVGAYLFIGIFNVIGLILIGSLSFSSIFAGIIDDGRFREWISFLMRRLFHRKSKVPVTRIDEEIALRDKIRIPWIVKKRVKIYGEDSDYQDDFSLTPPRLIEMNKLDAEFIDKDFPAIEQPKPDDVFKVFDASFETEIYNTRELDRHEAEQPFCDDDISDEVIVEEKETVHDAIAVNRIKSIIREKVIGHPIPYEKTDDTDDINEHISDHYKEDEIDELSGDPISDEKTDEVEFGRNSERSETTQKSAEESRVFDEIEINSDYIIPTSFLNSSESSDAENWKSEIRRNSELLVKTLNDFGIESRVIKVNRGPVIMLYEMQIAPGIKVNRVVGLSDDIAMALAASRVRIVAPIPGKSAVGVEVPNRNRELVTIGDVIRSKEYKAAGGRLKVAIGKDILGHPVTLDLKKLPHLLIAGATGAGKSVLVNTIITSLVYNYNPNYVRFILVDPKMVELQLYNSLPHLLTPVITEPHIVPKALKWAMFEMERRYHLLSELNTREIDKYNEKILNHGGNYETLPYILIIMDELADLMLVAAKEIEGFITRIAQKARAVGIHLVLATQRPSVDVITGIIKANFPARIAFQVAQKTDSRTIIDQNGAEKLLGKGDMLYQSPMSSFPVRIQGAFISEDEILSLVRHCKGLGSPSFIDIEDDIYEEENRLDDDSEDNLFSEAVTIVEETKKASASYLQRRLSIGYNRAAKMIELMETRGYIGQQQGSKPREVFI